LCIFEGIKEKKKIFCEKVTDERGFDKILKIKIFYQVLF
jgi:hypothetical protein